MKNPLLWPVFFRKKRGDRRRLDTGLSGEDTDTQAVVDHYLHLADNLLSTPDTPDEEDSEPDVA
jgi:hypothetical protein